MAGDEDPQAPARDRRELEAAEEERRRLDDDPESERAQERHGEDLVRRELRRHDERLRSPET